MKKLIALCALSLAACSPSPEKIAADFENAVNTKNVEALGMMLTDNVKTTVQGTTTEGKVAVLKSFEEMFKMNIKGQIVGAPTLEGNKLTWTAKSNSDGMSKLGLTDLEAKNEVLLENGKIAAFSWDLTPEAMTKWTTAMGEMNKKAAMELTKLFNEKNLDGALAMFTETATVTGMDATWTNAAQIKEGFTALTGKNTMLTPADMTVEGNKVSFMAKMANDELKGLKLDMLDTKNEVTFENGKVKSFTMMYTAEASQKLQEAMTATAAATPAAKKGKK